MDSNKLKDMLRRMIESGQASMVSLDDHNCNIREENEELESVISKFPASDAPVESFVAFGLEYLGGLVKHLAKEGHVKGLEVQLAFAKIADEFDSENEEHVHARAHLEHHRLMSQRMTREAEILSKFITIVRSAFEAPKQTSDA